MPVTPVLGRMRLEIRVEASLGYREMPCLKNKETQT